MTVYFVGAGPGAADLLTIRAARILERCDVCLYAGALVPDELLAHCRPGTRLVDSQRLTLDEIEQILVRAHEDGQDVARLHSGDPSLYSAVTEQAQRLRAHGIDFEIVPGVPAFAAAAAAVGRELTVPAVAQTVILTRHARRATALPAGEELDGLAAHGATLVLHLAVQALDELAPRLAMHYGETCPVAVVARASWPDELVLRGTLATIAGQVAAAGVRRTATILVGPALAGPDAAGACASHLYSASRDRTEA
jgi:precorrin-4/cobalt-precorrin-4 C11-methyltransferase